MNNTKLKHRDLIECGVGGNKKDNKQKKQSYYTLFLLFKDLYVITCLVANEIYIKYSIPFKIK